MINQDPRWALKVQRYHAYPHLRDQSVGEHSAQCLRILWAIYPDAPRHLIIHCVVHDIGEVVSGDPPYPVKAENPDLKAACDRIERNAHLRMCLPWSLPAPQKLNEDERCIFKLVEFIEMFEYGLDEQRLGNADAKLISDRCWEQAQKLVVLVEPAIRVRTEQYLNRRLKNGGNGYGKNRKHSNGSAQNPRRVSGSRPGNANSEADNRDGTRLSALK